MVCGLKEQVTERLVNNGMAVEQRGKLVARATAYEIYRDALSMAVDLARELGVSGIPFRVEGDNVVVDPEMEYEVKTLLETMTGRPLDSVLRQRLEEEVLASLRSALKSFKVSEKLVDKLKDANGNPIAGVAAADIANRSIQYLQGKGDKEISEEYVHFFVAALSVTNSPLYQTMRERITDTKEYQEVLTTHAGLEYDQQDMEDEAITKVILNRVKAAAMVGLRPEVFGVIKPGVQELLDSNLELASIGTAEQYSAYLDSIFPDSQVKDVVYHGITSRLKEKFDKFSKEFIKSGQGRYGEDGFFFSENKEEINKNYNNSGLITAIINLKNTSGDIYKNTWKETVEYLTEPQEIYGGKTDLDYLSEGYRATAWYKEGNWKKQVEKLKEDGWKIEETPTSFIKLGKISSQEKTYYSHLKKNLEKGTLPFNVNNSVEAIKKAKEQGLDGLIYENVLEESSIDNHNQYVVFEPEQIHILGNKQDIEGFKDFVTQSSTRVKPVVQELSEIVGDRDDRWWKRALAWLKNLFHSDPYTQAAMEILNKDLDKYASALENWDRTTIFRSVGDVQARVHDLIVAMSSGIELKEDWTKSELAGRLDAELIELLEDEEGFIARYMYKGKLVESRATDKAMMAFKWSIGSVDEVKAMSSGVRPKILRETGTALHESMQYLTLYFIEKDFKDKFNVHLFKGEKAKTLTEIKALSKLNDVQFKQLENTIITILKARSKGITGTQRVNVYPELTLMNPKERTAGTLDLLFIDPDGSGHVYDYKFFSPRNEDVELKNGEFLLREDPFRGPKGEGYEDQMGFYVRTLKNVLNVTAIKTSRLIPGHMRFTTKKGSINPELAYFNMDPSVDPELMQYPVANELPEGELSVKLNELYNRRDALKLLQRTDSVKRELSLITKTIKELLNTGMLLETRKQLGNLLRYAVKGLEVTDPAAEGYLTMHDLVSLMEALELYTDPVAITGYKTAGVKAEVSKDFANKMAILASVTKGTIKKLQDEGRRRLISDRYDVTTFSVPIRLDQMMSDIASVDNEYFKAAMFKWVSAQELRESRYAALVEKWTGLGKELSDWAKLNGTDVRKAARKLVRESASGYKLVSILNKEFKKKRDSLYAKASVGTEAEILTTAKFIKDHYQLREGAKQKYIDSLKKMEKWALIQYTTKESYGYKAAMAKFDRGHNLWSTTDITAWTKKSALRYLELRPEQAEGVYSPEYRELLSPGNETLLKFYTEWKTQFEEFNELLEHRHLNVNTVPSLLIGTIEAGLDGKGAVNTFMNNLLYSISVEEENEEQLGKNIIKNIPLRHLRPIKNSKKEFDSDRVSLDIGRAMLVFGDSLYQYVAMNEVEADIQMLRTLLLTAQEVEVDGGRFVKDAMGVRLKLNPTSDDTMAHYDTLMNMLLYGSIGNIQGKFITIGGRTVAMVKVLRQLRTFYSKVKMTLPLKAAAATAVSTLAFSYSKAVGNPNYSSDTLTQGFKLWMSDRNKYMALAKWFDVHTKDLRFESEQALRGDMGSQYMDPIYLYYPLIPADELSDRRLLMGMLYSHGVDKDGNLQRLSDLPKGTKSLVEMATLEEGEITGIPSTAKFPMKMRFMEEIKGVRGSMSPYKFALYEANTFVDVAMDFKSWMPEMIQDRWGTAKYNLWADRLTEGRYRSLGRQAFKDSFQAADDIPEELQELAWYEVLSRTTKNAMGLVQMLSGLKTLELSKERKEKLDAEGKWTPAMDKEYEDNRKFHQAKLKELQNNTTDPNLKRMDLDAYVKFQQANVTSAIVELQMVFSWMLVTGLLGAAWGDEDDKMLRRNQTKLLDLMGRVNMELAMFINPMEALYLNTAGIPVFGLLRMLQQVITNGADELSDGILGENSDNDTTPLGYHSLGFVYGTNTFRWLLKN